MSSPITHTSDFSHSPGTASEAVVDTGRPSTPPATSSTLLTNKGTPKLDKPSSRGINHKHPQYNAKILHEMEAAFCEIPYETFMHDFLQVASRSQATLPLYKTGFEAGKPFLPLKKVMKNEFDMYPIICDALNKVVREANDKFSFKIVAHHHESPTDDLKIDLAMYPLHAKSHEAFDLGNHSDGDVARTAWAWMTAAIEVKNDHSQSAFYFHKNETTLLRLTGDGKKAISQLAKYAAQLMLRQHRTFVFLAYISRDKARLVRWDRTGCIVSTSFDLNEQPQYLLNFVYRLASMTRAEQGYDTSAILASDEDLKVLSKYKSVNSYAMDWVDDIRNNAILYPIHKVLCRLADSNTYCDYLIGKHIVGSHSPTGRATKGFIAFNMKERRLCFLKDSWRPNINRIRPELEVYKHLHEHNVSHIATVIGGGDIETSDGENTSLQRTVSQNYMLLPGERPAERLHCRLVIQELGRPLATYVTSEDMIPVVLDALEGHALAWTNAGVLHRDISNNNILIMVNQDQDAEDTPCEGILIDWDLCKYKDELGQGPTQHGRSGTWIFMSGISLQYPFKPNALADDLESFVHVICLNALQFHQHNKTIIASNRIYEGSELKKINSENDVLAEHMSTVYYASTSLNGVTVGGETKVDKCKSGNPGFQLVDKESPLAILIKDLYELLKMHYAAIDFDDLQRYAASLPLIVQTQRPRAKGRRSNRVGPTRSVIGPLPLAGNLSFPPFAPNPAESTPAVVGRPVLDTHDAILAAFQKAIDAINKHIDGHLEIVTDKLPDQFVGLKCWDAQRTKGLSSGSKRKTAESEGSGDKWNDSGRAAKIPNLSSSTGSGLAAVDEEGANVA